MRTAGQLEGMDLAVDHERIPTRLWHSPIGRFSRRPLRILTGEVRADPTRSLWIAVVPGTSEAWGHHRAPPRAVGISREFVERLDRGYALLANQTVRFLLISGGTVDARRPDYNEALRGREMMLERHAAHFAGGDLVDRILVDPLPLHSTTNLRNAARLAVDVGLSRLVIATTMPANAKIWPHSIPLAGQTVQGWYFLHHRVSTFDWRCERSLGYRLGRIRWLAGRTAALEMDQLPRQSLLGDVYGP